MPDDQINEGFEADRVSQVACGECGQAVDVSQCAPFETIDCPICSHPLTVPAQIGPYYAYGFVGRGGMGSVYEAWDPTLERMVAIKVMLRSDGAGGRQAKAFEQEARAAALLSHPHIACVYDFGYHNDQPYLVMELVRGKHFDVMINEHGALDPALVVKTCLDVADGLSEASAAGLIHGDIKPENILFDDAMNAKLVDFGLATFVGELGGDRIRGTPFYIPPERLRRKRLDARSDIYSLGATMFHALTGQPPFQGDSAKSIAMARLSAEPPSARGRRPGLPIELDQIVTRMLALDPGRRHPTYGSLMGDFKRILAVLAGPPSVSKRATVNRTARPPKPAAKSAARRNWIIGLGAVAALLALGGGLLLWNHARTRQLKASEERVAALAAVEAIRGTALKTLNTQVTPKWSNAWEQAQQIETRVQSARERFSDGNMSKLDVEAINAGLRELPALNKALQGTQDVLGTLQAGLGETNASEDNIEKSVAGVERLAQVVDRLATRIVDLNARTQRLDAR